MPNLNIPLTSLGIDRISLLPDDSEYITNAPGETQNAIGEKKRVRAKYSTTYDMENVNVWVQYAIFQQGVLNSPTVKSPIDYTFTFPVGLAAGVYPMALVLPVGVNIDLNSNLKAFIEIIDATHFNVVADFYQIYDETTYQNQNYQDNHNKFLRDLKTSTNDLVITGVNSCYNSTASNFACTLRFEKDNQIHPPDTFPYTDNANPAFGGPWLAGFYNRNSVNNAPYFNTPQFISTRSSVPVSNFSFSLPTDIEFRITGATAPTKILAWIIRTDKFDNTVDMYNNYEANFVDVYNGNPSIGVDKIIGPVVDINPLGSDVYSTSFSIDGTKLSVGAKYRLIAIVYDNSADGIVNSFISDEYTVDSLPTYMGEGFDVIGALDDYNREFKGNDLECVIEERIKSSIKFYFPFDKWKNDIYNRLGLVVSNDIRRYLKTVNFTIYDTNVNPTLGTVQNIYDSQIANRIGTSLNYSSTGGMTLNFGNTWAEFSYQWRNRFEANIPCISTFVNGVVSLPVLGNQYWGGKTLKIKWSFIFEYDDYTVPFQDEIVVIQQIRVKDYGEMSVKHINDLDSDFDTISNICNNEELCFAGILQNPALEDRKLIVNIVQNGGVVTSLEEAEVWIGNELIQLTTDKITNEDEDYQELYGETAAKFCLDGSKLSLNSSYQISAIAKKFVETKKRVTELRDLRLTEEKDIRKID